MPSSAGILIAFHSTRPLSSGDRAPASGAGCVGSNPTGGTHDLHRKMGRDLRKRRSFCVLGMPLHASGCKQMPMITYEERTDLENPH